MTRHEAMRIAGERVDNARRLEVRNPWDGSLAGTVPKATVADVRRAFEVARAFTPTLTRYERSAILTRAAERLRARVQEVADLITVESGLCKKDTVYEVGRACDVLTFSAVREVPGYRLESSPFGGIKDSGLYSLPWP